MCSPGGAITTLSMQQVVKTQTYNLRFVRNAVPYIQPFYFISFHSYIEGSYFLVTRQHVSKQLHTKHEFRDRARNEPDCTNSRLVHLVLEPNQETVPLLVLLQLASWERPLELLLLLCEF